MPKFEDVPDVHPQEDLEGVLPEENSIEKIDGESMELIKSWKGYEKRVAERFNQLMEAEHKDTPENEKVWITGELKYYNFDKGYGFIFNPEKGDIYLHASEMCNKRHFWIEDKKTGNKVVNVSVIPHFKIANGRDGRPQAFDVKCDNCFKSENREKWRLKKTDDVVFGIYRFEETRISGDSEELRPSSVEMREINKEYYEAENLAQSHNFGLCDYAEIAFNFNELEKNTIIKSIKANEFSDDELRLMKQYINNALASEDEADFISARNSWWREKFGFENGSDKLKKTLLEMSEEYSDYGDEELSVAITQIIPFLGKQNEISELLNKYGKWNEESLKIAKDNSIFRAKLADILEKNISNKEFCRKFWEDISKLSQICGNEDAKEELRKSVLSQVATVVGFKRIGLNPIRSNAIEDVFYMADLMVGHNIIQIKSSHLTGGILIASSDEISSDGVVIQGNKATIVDIDGIKFERSIKNIRIKHGENHKVEKEKPIQNWRGYVIVVPPQEYDDYGEPSESLVQALKNRFSDAVLN